MPRALKNLLAAAGALALAACSALGLGAHEETLYVVEATAGGWSASDKARAAMNTIDGLETLHMSGARAVFRPAGEAPAEAEIASALRARGLGLVAYGPVRRPRAERLYLVDAGVTWATTAAEVREALIDEAGALDVYFEEEIQILVADADAFREEAVRKVLAASEVAFTEIAERAP